MLEVDLGGGRASSLRSNSKRPPTIGLSQSSLNLLDTKETHHDTAASDGNEKGEKSGNLNNNNEENPKCVKDNNEGIDSSSNPSNDSKKEEVMKATIQNEEIKNNEDESNNASIGQQDNQGFLDDSTTADQKSEGIEDSREEALGNNSEKDKLILNEYAKSKTKELLEKGSVQIKSFDNPTSEKEIEDDRKSGNGQSLSEDVTKRLGDSDDSRTVIGCDDSEANKSYHPPSVIETNSADKGTGAEGCGITRKQRKSKRDKKTKIEKVEKTFFV